MTSRCQHQIHIALMGSIRPDSVSTILLIATPLHTFCHRDEVNFGLAAVICWPLPEYLHKVPSFLSHISMFLVEIAIHWICRNATFENGGAHCFKPRCKKLSSPPDWILPHLWMLDPPLHIPHHNIKLLWNAHLKQNATRLGS